MDSYEEKDYTLIFCRRKQQNSDKSEILLGMKKRGFGVGRWNGYGGKVEAGETFEQGACRELEEESGIKCHSLDSIGYITFILRDCQKIMHVHVYQSWISAEMEAVETEEMSPCWYSEDAIPFEKMWPDDPLWFPYLLNNKKFVARYYDDVYYLIFVNSMCNFLIWGRSSLVGSILKILIPFLTMT